MTSDENFPQFYELPNAAVDQRLQPKANLSQAVRPSGQYGFQKIFQGQTNTIIKSTHASKSA